MTDCNDFKYIPPHTVVEHTDYLAEYLPDDETFLAKNVQDTNVRIMLEVFAQQLKEFESFINTFSVEMDPECANYLLEEWESMLGIPDDCFSTDIPIADRRRNALIKLAKMNVQTNEEFSLLANSFGVVATVEAGTDYDDVGGDLPTHRDKTYTIVITFEELQPSRFPLTFPFIFGSSVQGLLQCVFNKIKPANCNALFKLQEDPPPPASKNFHIELWTGDGAGVRPIVIGMDFLANTGLVMIKERRFVSFTWFVFDTIRGSQAYLGSSGNPEASSSTSLRDFNNDGYDIGSNVGVNQDTFTYVSYNFIKASSFLDIISYTGDGVAGNTVPHSLGTTAGFVIVKNVNSFGRWQAQHRILGGDYMAEFDLNIKPTLNSTIWNDQNMTNTVIELGTDSTVNSIGSEYMAYVFAHDTSPAGVCFCDSYLGTGATPHGLVNIGWEPQFLIIKSITDNNGRWIFVDSVRQAAAPGDNVWLDFTQGQERLTDDLLTFNPTGFTPTTSQNDTNRLGDTYIYVAFRAQ